MREKTMSKILGVSITAMLVAFPMVAGATGPTAAGTTDSPFSGVDVPVADQGHIASTAYVKGAYNAALGAVNERLQNDANTPVNIDKSVRTVLRTNATGQGENQASDTALVTEKAIAVALTNVTNGASTSAGAGIDKSAAGEFSVDLATDSGLVIPDTGNDAGKLMVNTGDGIAIDTNGAVGVDLATGSGLVVPDTGNDAGKLMVNAGDGVAIDANGAVTVDLATTNPGLQIDANDKLDVKLSGTTLATDANGLKVNAITTTEVAANTLVVQSEGIGVADQTATGHATDEQIPTAYAVRSAIDTAVNGMATQTGVEETIAATTIQVEIYDDWSDPTSKSNVTASVTKPTYTEGL